AGPGYDLVTGFGTPFVDRVVNHLVGVAGTSKLTGTVFNDLNNNGVQNPGETGLAGWTVYLDNNADGVLDGREETTSTDASGRYTFGGLFAGTYRVREVVKPGWTQSSTGPANVVTTNTNDTVTVGNIGNFKNASIAGNVYHDKNGNSARDPGEGGLQNWII